MISVGGLQTSLVLDFTDYSFIFVAFRFCDSPTEELDSRTPKGRGKRGRSAGLTPDLSNFTETRSSVSKKHTSIFSCRLLKAEINTMVNDIYLS